MRVRFGPAGSLRDLEARTAFRDGFAEAVTPDGRLVARAPDRPSLLALLRRLGVRPIAGRAPRAKVAVAAGSPFRVKVWRACLDIPGGRTATYGSLARKVGCGSARAIGGALAANPLAGLIPCHRVVAADGPGGFAWGGARKRRWLRKEARGAA
ncbi:MAG: methylated-DNA--[protein]-cysteine S-methyltransferase [Verrucomicrobiota bacterium]